MDKKFLFMFQLIPYKIMFRSHLISLNGENWHRF